MMSNKLHPKSIHRFYGTPVGKHMYWNGLLVVCGLIVAIKKQSYSIHIKSRHTSKLVFYATIYYNEKKAPIT